MIEKLDQKLCQLPRPYVINRVEKRPKFIVINLKQYDIKHKNKSLEEKIELMKKEMEGVNGLTVSIYNFN